MKSRSLVCACGGWFLLFSITLGLAQPSARVINGGFEEGLKGWQFTGDIQLETNGPLDGKASALIGPSGGSLSQRVEVAKGNDLTVSALIQSRRTNDCVFALRFLDKDGHEVMRVDSLSDIERDKKDSRKFSHFMKAHPLTKWVEVSVSKNVSDDSILVDQVGFEMTDENAANQQAACDLDQAMQPFWLGKKVYNEAVLMQSKEGKPAMGHLMFHPSRIISVRDYGLVTNYTEGIDYTLNGRTLFCTKSSRITLVRDEDLLKGELKWNTFGGKQIMVTYEHDDVWNPAHPAFLGDKLPKTMKKLKAHARLSIVVYGDSITHGVGESRLSHILPFLPPWPELFVHRLGKLYHDDRIELYNSAQSGADSEWGAKYTERMVTTLNPDLVLIAFGQNDFWRIPADSFANNIARIIKIIRNKNPNTEFLLISPLRLDPDYSANASYWNLVGEYAGRLKAMIAPGVQFVDLTAISESVYSAKNPKDCLNDPLHPNDYFARWYAQCVLQAFDPSIGLPPRGY